MPSLKDRKSSYPDPALIEVTGTPEWAGAIMNNPQLLPEDSEWTYLEGTPYVYSDSRYKYAVPVFQAHSIGAGSTVWFDDVVITEQTANGSVIQTWSLPAESMQGWYYWSENKTGSANLAPNQGLKGRHACVLIFILWMAMPCRVISRT